MARRLFFVSAVGDGRAVLEGEQARHLSTVLRAQPGQTFELSDCRRLYLGRVVAARASRVDFEIETELLGDPQPPPVTLLASIFKYDRMEWMLEKATELGVQRIVPVVAERTGTALARSSARRVERWRRIALEAAQQSRRVAPPEIAEPRAFPEALSEPGARRILLDENCPTGWPARLESAALTVLLIGPEGGWTDRERRQAAAAGFVPVSLGPLILRAETAAIAALALALLADDKQT